MRNDYMLIDEVMRRQVEEMMTWLAIRIDGLGLGLGLIDFDDEWFDIDWWGYEMMS